MLNAVQRFLRLSFKTQHQHWRGVGGANQTKAISPVDTQAVNHTSHGLEFGRRQFARGHQLLQLSAQTVWLAFSAAHVQFRGGETGGQGVEHSIGIGAAADNFQQTATSIGAVVKTKPTLFEEDVAAHLTTQR